MSRPLAAIMAMALPLLVLPFAAADEDAYRIMNDVIMSKGNVDYAAERVVEFYQNGRKARVVRQRVFRKRGDKQRIETLEPVTEAGQLVVSNGVLLWEYSPQRGFVVQRQLPSPTMLKNNRERSAQLIREALVLQYAGRRTMAKRPSHSILIKDKGGRLLRKCWVDADSNVELQVETYGENSSLSTSIEITSIDYSPSFVPGMFDFAAPAGVKIVHAPAPARRMTLAAAQRIAGFSAVVPTYLPPSYVFEADRVAVTTYRGLPTLWLTFCNGLDTFSLFENKCAQNSVAARQQTCATQWCDNGVCFTLVGNLTSDEVEKLVKSLGR